VFFTLSLNPQKIIKKENYLLSPHPTLSIRRGLWSSFIILCYSLIIALKPFPTRKGIKIILIE